MEGGATRFLPPKGAKQASSPGQHVRHERGKKGSKQESAADTRALNTLVLLKARLQLRHSLRRHLTSVHLDGISLAEKDLALFLSHYGGQITQANVTVRLSFSLFLSSA
jgi:hypothetical protein